MSEHHETHGNGHAAVTHIHTEEEPKLTAVVSPTNAPLTIDREFKFSFKKQTIKDDLGEEIKRPPVILNIPIPTFDGLVVALENSKTAQYILDLVEEAIKEQARSLVSDEEKPVNRQEDLDLTKLTLDYIANLPKSERTGGGISKDTWSDWEKDYVEVMVEQRKSDPKALEKVTKAAKLFTGRLNQCRTDKPVLKFLREQLSVWARSTTQLDDFADVYKYLDDRASELLTKDNVSQLASL